MATEHIIKSYDEELRRLNNAITQMGGLGESQLAAAIDAVMKRDSELAARVVEGDAQVDQLEHEVDGLVVRLLALRQPMARDLREILAALRIASDLERICDYAANVAKRSIVLNQSPPVKPVYTLPRMVKLAQGLTKDVLDAYVARDADKALVAWAMRDCPEVRAFVLAFRSPVRKAEAVVIAVRVDWAWVFSALSCCPMVCDAEPNWPTLC